MSKPSDQPFFHRYQTKLTISEICSQDDLVIFAGAGVTIDKSQLNWSAMIDSLLKQHMTDDELRKGYLESTDVLAAASAVHELYYDGANKKRQSLDAREKMFSQLSTTLYRPGLWSEGRLTKSIADFVSIWALTSTKKIHSGRKIAIVTTNYDDYLLSDVKSSVRAMRRSKAFPKNTKMPKLSVVFPTEHDPLRAKSKKKAQLSDWVRNSAYPNSSEIGFAYLHGRIPKPPTEKQPSRLPVISELDYNLTRKVSSATLRSLFSRSSVLLVGTSLSDPPQLDALFATKDAAAAQGRKRWAIFTVPAQGSLPVGFSQIEYMRLTRKRLQALGVEPVFVDYRVQTVQFFRELAICAGEDHPERYKERHYKKRYGRRLLRWWNRWNKANAAISIEEQQMYCSYLLSSRLTRLQEMLGAPASEVMKIEVWIRWEPARHRKLRLWCSSAARWNELAAMRDAFIETDSDTLSIEAFRTGRPVAGEVHDSRWKSYVAMPLWVQNDLSEMILGVVTIASMADLSDSSLVPSRNSASIEKAFRILEDLGAIIVDPDPRRIRDEIAKGGRL